MESYQKEILFKRHPCQIGNMDVDKHYSNYSFKLWYEYI